MTPDHLRIQPGQEALTPEQEAEARRFAQERVHAQLSTEPVNEAVAETFLRQAYRAAGLETPAQIRWLDGPMQLVELFLPQSVWEHWIQHRKKIDGQSVGASGRGPLPESRSGVWESEWAAVRQRVRDRIYASIRYQVSGGVWEHVGTTVQAAIWASMRDHVSIPERLR